MKITESEISRGVLYIIGTPVGNLGDMSDRARDVLLDVKYIASEDTRRTRKLLNHFNINGNLISYYKEREKIRGEKILQFLHEGHDVALVSDAGTPCISDPGVHLVKLAQEHGIEVIPIPGPSALTSALSVSGIECTPFYFSGFLPSKKNSRRQVIESFLHMTCAIVFYEAPHRIIACLEDCCQILGYRHIFVARELTKLYEEKLFGPISEVLENLKARQSIKGEFVVVLAPTEQRDENPSDREIQESLLHFQEEGYSLRDAVKKTMKDFNLPRSAVYSLALELWKEK